MDIGTVQGGSDYVSDNFSTATMQETVPGAPLSYKRPLNNNYFDDSDSKQGFNQFMGLDFAEVRMPQNWSPQQFGGW